MLKKLTTSDLLKKLQATQGTISVSDGILQFESGETIALSHVVTSAEKSGTVMPLDFLSHQASWRSALELAEKNAGPIEPDRDDAAYWRHELAASRIKLFTVELAAKILQVTQRLVSNNDEYIDVDVNVLLGNGSEFMQRMYVTTSKPDALIRDEIRFSPGQSEDFDDGGKMKCPAEVLAAFEDAIPTVNSLIRDAAIPGTRQRQDVGLVSYPANDLPDLPLQDFEKLETRVSESNRQRG